MSACLSVAKAVRNKVKHQEFKAQRFGARVSNAGAAARLRSRMPPSEFEARGGPDARLPDRRLLVLITRIIVIIILMLIVLIIFPRSRPRRDLGRPPGTAASPARPRAGRPRGREGEAARFVFSRGQVSRAARGAVPASTWDSAEHFCLEVCQHGEPQHNRLPHVRARLQANTTRSRDFACAGGSETRSAKTRDTPRPRVARARRASGPTLCQDLRVPLFNTVVL